MQGESLTSLAHSLSPCPSFPSVIPGFHFTPFSCSLEGLGVSGSESCWRRVLLSFSLCSEKVFLLDVARLIPFFCHFRDAVLLSSDTGLLMKPVVILPLCRACVLFPLASAGSVVSLCQTAGCGAGAQPRLGLHRRPLACASHPVTRRWLLLTRSWGPARPLVGATVRLSPELAAVRE